MSQRIKREVQENHTYWDFTSVSTKATDPALLVFTFVSLLLLCEWRRELCGGTKFEVSSMINHPPGPLPMGAEWVSDMPKGADWTPPAQPAQPVREVHFRNVQGLTGHPTQVVEWLYASVGPANLGAGTVTNAAVRNWVQHEVGNPKDDAGHIIGNNQGGLGTVLWNIFPQSGNFNRGVFSRDVERMIHDAAQQGQVRIWFRFVYGNPSRPGRPSKFSFLSLFPHGQVMNNDLENP